MDWELLASGPNYPKAARNCVPAGARVGELIRGLEEVGGAMLEDFHTVGFSLGGQASFSSLDHHTILKLCLVCNIFGIFDPLPLFAFGNWFIL